MAMRSSFSGSSASESGSSASSRVRTVKLTRRAPPSKLGFSLRGGSEHGTGFFVTSLEPNSEAHLQGLVVGDQIIRVNGFPVEDATHKEVLQLIQGQTLITLKVKSVGMIPVKESASDELTWRLVEGESAEVTRSQLIEDDPALRAPADVRMLLKVPPKAKLGCGICKGPEWKPGVFVQFTKENSIARQAGLRPGDQIVQCNNFTFTPDTPFNEAVGVLRCSGLLELVVRKGAGLELFPGESSGYNSSASSVTGDNPWPHRLSVVAEEAAPSLKFCQSDAAVNRGERRVNGAHNGMNGCTVIHVNGEENDSKTKVAEICMVSQQLETKTTTVLVEVHQSEEDDVSHTQSDSSTERLTNCSSVSSFTSSASSLSSAISQELERRSKRGPLEGAAKAAAVVHPTDKLIKSGLAKEKVHQHEQLMHEFKQAHRKMFSSCDSGDKAPPNDREEAKENKDCEPHKRLPPVETNSNSNGKSKNNGSYNNISNNNSNINGNIKNNNNSNSNINGNIKSNGSSNGNSNGSSNGNVNNSNINGIINSKIASNNGQSEKGRDVRDGEIMKPKRQAAPPPPPPLPIDECARKGAVTNGTGAKKYPAPPPPSPPYCPTPDYDTASLASEEERGKKGGGGQKGDAVEMQSLESFKLNNPAVSRPKPPKTYFANAAPPPPHGTCGGGAKEASKPMVTIREYPGRKERRSPTKFEFLQNAREAPDSTHNEAITSRLHNELSETLSRANLLSRTNQLSKNEPATECGQAKGTVVTICVSGQEGPKGEGGPKQAPFYLFPQERATTAQPHKLKPHTVDNCTKNSVTFHFGGKDKEARGVGGAQPSGILKNSAPNVSHVKIQPQPLLDRIPPHKSIKFGGI